MNAISEILKTVRFATNAHHGQERKYTGEAYITHPIAVAEFVSNLGMPLDMVKAAILHDTIEDTHVTEEVIRRVFGDTVAEYVVGLTEVSKPEDGNRAQRKQMDREFLATQSNQVKTIKLCDLIHNTESIQLYAPEFAKVYMAEKRLLLDEALMEGDKRAWVIADAIVNEYYEENA